MSARPRTLRIAVGGMIGAVPRQGGATWAVLQYVLGFAALGHDVWFAEDVRGWSAATPAEHAARVEYLETVTARFGIEQWALLADGRPVAGPAAATFDARVAQTDVLVDLSGTLADTALVGAPVTAFVDLDPAFVQLWQADGIDMRFDRYGHVATVGLAIGSSQCSVPTLGRSWIPTLPPVVLDHWPVVPVDPSLPFTTVAHWRGYGSVEHDGQFLGQKAHSTRDLFALPRRLPAAFVVALGIHPDERPDLAALHEHGWQLVDPQDVVSTPDDYAGFIGGSMAELGLTKSGYVRSRCGWFSDRSACYLAAGRPVILQDTGLASYLPIGEGLLTYDDLDGAVEAAQRIRADLPRHAAAARRLAEERLDARVVLAALLDAIGAT